MVTFLFALRFSAKFTKFEGFFSLGFIHFRFSIERLPLLNLGVVEAEKIHVEKVRDVIQKKQYVLDSTKRKTLSSGNQKKFSVSWDEVSGRNSTDSTKKGVNVPQVTEPLEQNFVHDFFGTQLIIGDIRVGKNLPKSLHRLEIIKNQVFIDNIPQEVNQGELEKIKSLIRNSRR
jgi:hypothetical protein